MLKPEGFGRGTFRLAEIIQIGRVPVMLYDDIPWLPYKGSKYSVENFGLVIKGDSDGAQKLISFINNSNITTIYNLIDKVIEVLILLILIY